MKWLSQITRVSHSQFFRGGEATTLDVTVYMVPTLTCWLNQPTRPAFPSADFLFLSYLKRSTACTVVFVFRFVSKYYFFIAGYNFGTRAEGLMTDFFFFSSSLKQTNLSQLASKSEACSCKPVCGTRSGHISSEGGKAGRMPGFLRLSLWWSELC